MIIKIYSKSLFISLHKNTRTVMNSNVSGICEEVSMKGRRGEARQQEREKTEKTMGGRGTNEIRGRKAGKGSEREKGRGNREGKRRENGKCIKKSKERKMARKERRRESENETKTGE